MNHWSWMCGMWYEDG